MAISKKYDQTIEQTAKQRVIYLAAIIASVAGFLMLASSLVLMSISLPAGLAHDIQHLFVFMAGVGTGSLTIVTFHRLKEN